MPVLNRSAGEAALDYLALQRQQLDEVATGAATALRWTDRDGRSVSEVFIPPGVQPNLPIEFAIAKGVANVKGYDLPLRREAIASEEATERLFAMDQRLAELAMTPALG